MPRVKRGKMHVKRRKNLLQKTKGYKLRLKNIPRLAKVAVTKAGVHAYRDRKKKKRTNRQLHNIKINAVLENFNLSYSKFIGEMKKKNILIDRKILADLAENNPKIFQSIVKKVQK